jgi:hypothetical protein
MHMISELRHDTDRRFLLRHRRPFRLFWSSSRPKLSMRLKVGERVRRVGCRGFGRRRVDACGRSPRCRTLAATRAPGQMTSPVRAGSGAFSTSSPIP